MSALSTQQLRILAFAWKSFEADPKVYCLLYSRSLCFLSLHPGLSASLDTSNYCVPTFAQIVCMALVAQFPSLVWSLYSSYELCYLSFICLPSLLCPQPALVLLVSLTLSFTSLSTFSYPLSLTHPLMLLPHSIISSPSKQCSDKFRSTTTVSPPILATSRPRPPAKVFAWPKRNSSP